jgi:ElaB/YqjD/DUF883 family membrane-anchored ribosome-binding protein
MFTRQPTPRFSAKEICAMTTPNSGTDRSKTKHHASYGDVGEDLAEIRRDLAALKGDALDAAAGTMQAGAHAVRDAGDLVADRATGAYDEVCDYVRANPTTSMLIAAGVGVVVGRLLFRR